MIKAVYKRVDFAPYYYNVHILVNGYYAGVGRFCDTLEEVKAFAEYHKAETIERVNY